DYVFIIDCVFYVQLSLMLCFCAFDFCFFFQAEDGIRDSSVTGVQTCALPICTRYLVRQGTIVDLISLAYGIDNDKILAGPSWLRSEERRVGKECRYRG